jgi:type I restriction enzyme S subunit
MTSMKEHTLVDCFSLRARIGWQGLRSDEFKTEGPYLVTGVDFHNGRVDWDDCYHVSVARYEQDKGIQLRENDLLVTKDGTVGKTAFVVDCPEQATLNSHIFLVRSKDGSVEPEYLYYVLNSYIFTDFMKNILTGTTIKGLTQGNFYKFTFEAPDVPAQKKIVEVLESIDDVIDRTRDTIGKYQNLKKGLLQDRLGKGKEVSLADKRYFVLNPSIRKLPDTFYYINLESVVDGLLVVQKTEERASAPSRAQRLLQKNDILFQMVRPYQQNNLFFDLKSDLPYVASTGYAQIRTNQNPLYVYYAMHSFEFVSEVNRRCTGSSYPAINSTELSKVTFKLPERKIQDEIAQQLLSIDSLIRKEMDALKKYENIKCGLVKDLLSGMVEFASM